MKTRRPLFFLVSLLLIVGLLSGCRAQKTDSTGPKAISDQPTATPPPEDTPAPQTKGGEAQAFFGEEFDNPLSGDWKSFMIYNVNSTSDPEAVTVQAGDGKLAWNFDTKALAYYLVYGAYSYQDVKLETSFDNRGVNSNAVSLICRYDPKVGWYEFQITNSGLYNIYAMEPPTGGGEYVYNRIANGGSLAIKQGKGVNEFSAVCQGQQLTLYINGEKVASATDAKYSYGEGQIGIAVASTNVTPVTVNMDWLKVSKP
jgi:hypothetical protein